jgi:putative transposase
MAVIDWYSRYVLGWALSTTLDADFCIEAVGRLLDGRRCEIFNTRPAGRSSPPRASPSRCWTKASGSA